ncbi:hypothetical protein [uncultured Methylobacterium sp.]|uniref:hypothetical protein n=1 Tax=uncultured Methylobacterium sp. TaxID=157278 RepID=UPI0035CAC1EB
MPARMPNLIAGLASAAAMLLIAPSASARAPGFGDDAAPRSAPSHHRIRRPSPDGADRAARGYAPGLSGYGPPSIVRAYLPRNTNVPMYNEPPTR